VRVGDNCRDCAAVYATYRCNSAAPYEAMRPVVRYKSGYTSDRHIVRYDNQRMREAVAPVAPVRTFKAPVTAREMRRIKTHDMARVVSTSRALARAPQFKPEVRTFAPAVHKSAARGNAQVAVAYKGRGDARAMSATREKGAHKKVRDAE